MIKEGSVCKVRRYVGSYPRASHHEFRYLDIVYRYRNIRNAQYETPKKFLRFYCVYCGEILEKEDR